jgi:hypothetical protein
VDENCGFSCHFARVRRLTYGFFFSEKTSSFVRFFGGQKTGTEWSTKATDPVFWNCEMGEGNAQINFEGLKERRSE